MLFIGLLICVCITLVMGFLWGIGHECRRNLKKDRRDRNSQKNEINITDLVTELLYEVGKHKDDVNCCDKCFCHVAYKIIYDNGHTKQIAAENERFLY